MPFMDKDYLLEPSPSLTGMETLKVPHGLIHYDPSTSDGEYNHLLPILVLGEKQPRGIYLEPIKWPPILGKFDALKRKRVKMDLEPLESYQWQHQSTTVSESSSSVEYYTEDQRKVCFVDFSGEVNTWAQPPETTEATSTGQTSPTPTHDSSETTLDESTEAVSPAVYVKFYYTDEQVGWLILHIDARYDGIKKNWVAISAAYHEEFNQYRKPLALSQKWSDMKDNGDIEKFLGAARTRVQQGKTQVTSHTQIGGESSTLGVKTRYSLEQLEWIKLYASEKIDNGLTVRHNWRIIASAYTKRFGIKRSPTSLYQRWLQFGYTKSSLQDAPQDKVLEKLQEVTNQELKEWSSWRSKNSKPYDGKKDTPRQKNEGVDEKEGEAKSNNKGNSIGGLVNPMGNRNSEAGPLDGASQPSRVGTNAGYLTPDGRIIVHSSGISYTREEECTIYTICKDAEEIGSSVDWAQLADTLATRFAIRRPHGSIVHKWRELRLKVKKGGKLRHEMKYNG